MEILISVAAVAVLGGAGSVLRHIAGFWSGALPWGILFVNSIASFVVGLAISSGEYEIALVVGLAGGLSTFSTFAAQSYEYLKNEQRFRAIANLVLNLALPALSLLTAVIWL
jgi:fluoride exporter